MGICKCTRAPVLRGLQVTDKAITKYNGTIKSKVLCGDWFLCSDFMHQRKYREFAFLPPFLTALELNEKHLECFVQLRWIH